MNTITNYSILASVYLPALLFVSMQLLHLQMFYCKPFRLTDMLWQYEIIGLFIVKEVLTLDINMTCVKHADTDQIAKCVSNWFCLCISSIDLTQGKAICRVISWTDLYIRLNMKVLMILS